MEHFKELSDKLLLYKSNLGISDTTFLSIAVSLAVILLTCLYYAIKHRGVLPGPTGLPYVGMYPFLKDDDCHLKLTEYIKKYGDVYSFTFSGKLIIHLGSVKSMREFQLNKSECFAGRFTDFNILTFTQEHGVAMVNGEPWSVLRKFFVQKFKEHGLYSIRDNLAGPVYDSLMATIEDLRAQKGKPLNAVDLLMIRCSVTLRKILFGEDGISEDLIIEMNRLYALPLECMAGTGLLLIGPMGKLLFNTVPRLRECMKNHEQMRKLLYDACKKVESRLNEDHTTCVVEDYYKERNIRKRIGDPSWKVFTDKALVCSLSQFVGDGIHSVAAFIGVFLNALLEHPEEQKKIYAEIMEVVGPSRQPVLEDKTKLPYMNAFVNEVIRTCCFFPFFPSLECSKEFKYKGYRIPKGSITLLNFWAANHDPSTYENPNKFDPSRFLSGPGKLRPEMPVLFGMGKRNCSGEGFVMLQVFLFLTTIIKNFEILPPEDPSKNTPMYVMSGKLDIRFKPRREVEN